jgi:hypothetical protein
MQTAILKGIILFFFNIGLLSDGQLSARPLDLFSSFSAIHHELGLFSGKQACQ